MAHTTLHRSKQVLGTLIDTKEKSGNTHKLDEIMNRYDDICQQITDLEENVVYVNEDSGEMTCLSCGGYTLRSSIANAKPGQQVFAGINGERFIAVSITEPGVACEYC